MGSLLQLQRWVIQQIDRKLFPFTQNGRLNLSGATTGQVSSNSKSLKAVTQSFTDASSITVTHNRGSYPIVQVLTNQGELCDFAKVRHLSVNEFRVDIINSSVRGWGWQWGSIGWGGGGMDGTKWGNSAWGSAGWGTADTALATASGTIVYL